MSLPPCLPLPLPLSSPGEPSFADPLSRTGGCGGGSGSGIGLGMDPLPDAAAARFASWQNLRDIGGAETGRPVAAEPEDGSAPSPGGALDGRFGGRGGVAPPAAAVGVAAGGGGGGGGDVLSREAFEALLPCIFHADAVHDEVLTFERSNRTEIGQKSRRMYAPRVAERANHEAMHLMFFSLSSFRRGALELSYSDGLCCFWPCPLRSDWHSSVRSCSRLPLNIAWGRRRLSCWFGDPWSFAAVCDVSCLD